MKRIRNPILLSAFLLLLLGGHLSVFAQNARGKVIRGIRWSPDGTQIAIAQEGYCTLDDSHSFPIQIIDPHTLKTIMALPGDDCSAVSVDWSPSGDKLVSVPSDGFGQIWDATTGKLLVTTPRPGTGSIYTVWSNQGTEIATTFGSNGITIWDGTTGKFADLQSIGGTTVDWSPDDTKLVTGSGYDPAVVIWDSLTGKELRTLNGHTDGLIDVKWSPDGSKIASGSLDNTVRIWDTTSGTSLQVMPVIGISNISWSPNNEYIATARFDDDGSGAVDIWDALKGTQLNTFPYQGRVYKVDWSPDGTQIAYGGEGIDGKTAEIQIIDIKDILASPTAEATP